LLAAQTTTNLLSLLLAPIKAYHSALTLLAVPAYEELLVKQPLSTRVSIGQAVVASLLRGNTRIQQVDDVKGVLQLCQDLVKDTSMEDRPGASAQVSKHSLTHQYTAVAEEQGWLARIVHLFVAEDLGTHLAVSMEATCPTA
jgi:vacuolar protein sorting-associated protein 35